MRLFLTLLAGPIATLVPLPVLAAAPATPGVATIGTGWAFDPLIIAPLALLAWAYMQGTEALAVRRRPVHGLRQALFYAGLLILWAALQSPLAAWARVAYEGHAWQGVLLRILGPMLIFWAAPQSALIAGLGPRGRRWLARRMPHRGAVKRALRAAVRPLPAAVAFIATLYVWELPPVQNAAASHWPLAALMKAMFLATGLAFFATVFHPQDPPLGPGHARRQMMLIATSFAQLLAGAAITMKPMILYPAYAFGLNDEAAGGYIIWTPSCMILLAAIIAVVHQWNGAEERRWARAQRGGLSNAEMMELMPQTADELWMVVTPKNRRTAYGLSMIPLFLFVMVFATVETVRFMG